MSNVEIRSLDGTSFDAQIAFPKSEHGPGLILIRGLFSKPEAIEKLSAVYADMGFVVICPNIFHRQADLAAQAANQEPDWEQAAKLYKNFDVEAGVRDLLATLAHVRQMPECGGKVGAVGYCLGCRLAFLMASRSDIDCTVGYYGVGLDTLLDEVYDIRMPCLLHFGDKDKLLPPSARERVLKALSKNEAITTYLYEGAEHGFMRETSPTYSARLAELANERTHEFLFAYLKDSF